MCYYLKYFEIFNVNICMVFLIKLMYIINRKKERCKENVKFINVL